MFNLVLVFFSFSLLIVWCAGLHNYAYSSRVPTAVGIAWPNTAVSLGRAENVYGLQWPL